MLNFEANAWRMTQALRSVAMNISKIDWQIEILEILQTELLFFKPDSLDIYRRYTPSGIQTDPFFNLRSLISIH